MIELNGENLTIEKIVEIARNGREINISNESKKKILKSRRIVESMFEKGETAYGTTTGIGELANVLLTKEQSKNFSKYLIYSHAGRCGEPASIEDSRAAIISRINVLCKGVSGVRLEVAEFISEMMNKGITPVMCKRSVGACGDLAPLAQAMLVPIGEGEAFYNGDRLSGKDALDYLCRKYTKNYQWLRDSWKIGKGAGCL